MHIFFRLWTLNLISTELLIESSRWSKVICNQSERILDKSSCKRGKCSYLTLQIHFYKKWFSNKFFESGIIFNFFFLKSITLAELCYNFGVDTYYREEYDNCIAWLRWVTFLKRKCLFYFLVLFFRRYCLPIKVY